MGRHFSRRYLLLTGAGAGVAGAAALVRWDALATARPPVAPSVSLPGELQYAKQRADLCGAGNAVGVGLRGEYFGSRDFSGSRLLVRVDRTVDFDAGFEWPADQPAPPQSVRWSGWVKPPLTGAFRFHVQAPGVRVSVAHRGVVGEGAQPDAAVDMALGRFYPIVVEVPVIDRDFKGRWQLEWTAPHGLRYVIPTALLFMPTSGAT